MPEVSDEKLVRVPLRVDESGAVRVGQTRVSLLSVLTAFQRGETPEQIVHSYPSLQLSDAYAVVSYYLMNRNELDAWVEKEKAFGESLQKEAEALFPQAGIRERLLRRKGGQ